MLCVDNKKDRTEQKAMYDNNISKQRHMSIYFSCSCIDLKSKNLSKCRELIVR